jgi:hypothetical protein
MLCLRIGGGLDLLADSGVRKVVENDSVSLCYISIKYCCDAANKAVDEGGAGA